jgi:tripartite-type tricarboxylate transporter receptor subunit TctC
MKSTLMMGVGPSIKHKTAAEFFAAAKANPGKYTYASVSATTRLAGNMLGRAAGIDIVNIPYKNFGDLISNWLAGKIDILMADGPSINPYLSQGVRVLGACSLTRSPFYPDVPTLQEQGLKGFEIYGWHAAFAPVKTPPEAVAALRDAIAKAWRSKYVTDLFKKMSVEPLELVGDALAEYQRKDFDRWGAAIREAGMTGTL